MLRMISVLIVVTIMALMWLLMADSTTGSGTTDCDPTSKTSIDVSIPKGLEPFVDTCR